MNDSTPILTDAAEDARLGSDLIVPVVEAPPDALLVKLASPVEPRQCGACVAARQHGYTTVKRIAAHLEEALSLMDDIKHDARSLTSLIDMIEDLQAQSEDVGPDLYIAFGHMQSWIDKQRDECEWRKQNGID